MGLRAAGLWLALIALLFKSAIPTGVMLAPDTHNRIAIVLCSGHGSVVAATLDLDTGEIVEDGLSPSSHNDQSSGAKADQPCPFAGAVAATIASPTVSGITRSIVEIILDLDLRHVWPDVAPTGPPLPGRGPPALA